MDSSFILTMWYVNLIIVIKKNKFFQSFILTMWYVNELFNPEEGQKRIRFILTMWYVNQLELSSTKKEQTVLY